MLGWHARTCTSRSPFGAMLNPRTATRLAREAARAPARGMLQSRAVAHCTAAFVSYFARMESRLARLLALVQGVFYVLTGLWAIVDLDSFEAVTGPKTDDWLVKTVGVLVTVVGLVLLLAAREKRITPEIALLGAGSALGLAAIDVIYALSGVFSPIYLLDAVVEIGIAILWGVARARR